MKVTFVFYDVLKRKSLFSIPLATLSACLKKAGHKVNLFVVRKDENLTKEQYQNKLPHSDIFGFSCMTGTYPKFKEFIKWTKEKHPKKLTIVGGSHALLNPEDVINSEGVDGVCIGEGEIPIVQLANKLKAKKNIYNTKNFWFKKEEKIIKNERLPLIEDLNKIPFMDRGLFDYYSITDYKDAKQIVVMASRGCPYNCRYCANHKIRNLFPNKNKWVRLRKVDNVIKEIKEIIAKFGPHKMVKFVDDTLVQDKEWFEELLEKYPKEIGLSIDCQARPNEITEDIMRKLKRLGVAKLEMGIESGNAFIRYKIMNRYITNKQIVIAYKLARKYKIPTISFNIIGLVFESFDMILDTIKINALARPSWSKPLYFQPFPNTDLLDLCKEYGFMKDDKILPTLFEGSPLKSPYVTKKQLKFVYKNFRPLISLYRTRFMWPVWDAIITCKFFPYNLFSKIAPVFHLKEIIGSKFPKLTKIIKKVLRKR